MTGPTCPSPPPPDLTRNKNVHARLSHSDGLVGAILSHTQEFITSPTAHSIPRPPIGSQRDLFRRRDAFYGEDDYCKWPQPYHPSYPHLPLIPKRPSSAADEFFRHRHMWSTVDDTLIEYTSEVLGQRRGVLVSSFISDIRESIQYIALRSERLRVRLANRPDLLEYITTLENIQSICLTRVASISSSVRVLQLALSELQRSWLTIVALSDFYRVFHDGEKLITLTDRMGCFVWDDMIAFKHMKVEVPFYYIRPLSEFDRQNICLVVACDTPCLPDVVLEHAVPSFPAIFTGQAGAEDKFVMIYTASIHCLDVTSPFENRHFPGEYISSWHLGNSVRSPTFSLPAPLPAKNGPMRSQRSKTARESVNPLQKHPHSFKPQVLRGRGPLPTERNIFQDLDSNHPFVPPPIHAWRASISRIDPRHAGAPLESRKQVFILPHPGLFFGVTSEERTKEYLRQWKHFRPAWLHRCQDLENPQRPLTAAVWRKILSAKTSGLWHTNNEPTTEKQRLSAESTAILKTVTEQFAPGRPLLASDDAPLERSEIRQLVWEICEINFRYELRHVDRCADSSAPPSAAGDSNAAYQRAISQHHLSRDVLIADLFSSSSVFDITPQCNHLHSSRHETRARALHVLWKIMDTWPEPKPACWKLGVSIKSADWRGEESRFERELADYYAQTVYNITGRPPILPRIL